MATAKFLKASKWLKRISYAVLVGLAVLIGYIGFTAPKADGKLLLAKGEVFNPSQLCLETGKPELPKTMYDAFVSANGKEWIAFHPVVISFSSLWRTLFGRPNGSRTTLAYSSTMYFVDPSKGNQHGTRFLQTLKLEWSVKKCALFELYASRVYFGKNRFGIAEGTRGFFSKEPADLSIPQAAFLAAITRNPNILLNRQDFSIIIYLRNKAIDQMSEDGLISTKQAKLAKQEPLQFH